MPLDKGDPATVDDRDGVNEEDEYKQWMLRELTRLKRHAEETAAYERTGRPLHPLPPSRGPDSAGFIAPTHGSADGEGERGFGRGPGRRTPGRSMSVQRWNGGGT